MKRPNLLLLIPDQHRADWVAGGGLPLRTPVLQGLAARGVTFERAYCTSPGGDTQSTVTTALITPLSRRV